MTPPIWSTNQSKLDINKKMNLEDIKKVDAIYRVYYNAYKKNEMVGIYDVARETELSNKEVEEAILFLEGENKIAISNKGFDPINSGVVYRLTKEGFTWFAKTNYENELINKPNSTSGSSVMNIYGGNNQLGNDNVQNCGVGNKESGFRKYLTKIIIGVIIALLATGIAAYLNLN